MIGNPHRLDHEEVFIILEGRLNVMVNEEEATLPAGDSLAVPADAHAAMADGREIGTPPWAR